MLDPLSVEPLLPSHGIWQLYTSIFSCHKDAPLEENIHVCRQSTDLLHIVVDSLDYIIEPEHYSHAYNYIIIIIT